MIIDTGGFDAYAQAFLCQNREDLERGRGRGVVNCIRAGGADGRA